MTTTDTNLEDVTGVVVLAAEGSTAFLDDAAETWIDELGGRRAGSTGGERRRGPRTGRRGRQGRVAGARVRAESGRWLTVRGSALADGPGGQAGGRVIEPARPHELAPLVADARSPPTRAR